MFKTRLLSGILLVIIALITLITGGNLLFLVLLAISLIGMTELYRVFSIEKKAPGSWAMCLLCCTTRFCISDRFFPGRAELVHAALYGISDLPDGSPGIRVSQV